MAMSGLRLRLAHSEPHLSNHVQHTMPLMSGAVEMPDGASFAAARLRRAPGAGKRAVLAPCGGVLVFLLGFFFGRVRNTHGQLLLIALHLNACALYLQGRCCES